MVNLKRCLLLSIIFFYLTSGPIVSAREVNWVVVEGVAQTLAGDLEKARRQAIENAERNAVSKALIPGISVDTLLVNLRLSGSILGAIPYGTVVSKQILKEGTVESTGKSELSYRVWIKAGVVQETGKEDPSFYIDATINQFIFREGDELEIHIRSTRDCHLSIYNILEDEKIIQLLPNSLSSNTFLKAYEKFTFPTKKDRQRGLRLRVHLPENKDVVAESIYILALPHPFKLGPRNVQEGIFGVFTGQTAFMKDLIGAVVNIPSGKRAEALMQYDIRKRK